MHKSSRLAFNVKLAISVTVFLWSSAFVAIRTGLTSFSPGSLALFRFLIAAICMTLIYFNLPKRNKISTIDKLSMLLIGAFTLGGYHVALNYGEMTISAGLSSFVISLSPVVTTLLAIAFLREGINKLGVMGLCISTVGMVFILFGHDGNLNINMGLLYVMAATVSGSIFNVLQKPFLKKYSALEVTTYGIWGTMFTLGYYLPTFTHEVAQASWNAIFCGLYLGIIPTALATVTWTYTLAAMPATRAINFIYFMPIITTGLGWLCLGEIPAVLSFVGGVIALVGVWVVNRSYYHASKKEQQAAPSAFLNEAGQ